jgi:hypothetical protein
LLLAPNFASTLRRLKQNLKPFRSFPLAGVERPTPCILKTTVFSLRSLSPSRSSHCCSRARSTQPRADLYQSDPQHGSINRYSPGNGTPTIFASGIAGLTSRIAFNRAGDLFVGDANGILKITPGGVKSTFATGVKVNGIRCDAAGNVFVSDGTSRSILKITLAGAKSTFAPAVDTFDLLFDTNGDLLAIDYGADPSNPGGPGINGQGKIYRFQPDGTKIASKSMVDRPTCIARDGKGNTYYASSDGVIYQGSFSYDPVFGGFGSTTLYTGGLGNIQSMVCDPAGNLFVSTPSGIIKFNYHGGQASKSTFSSVGTSLGLFSSRLARSP